MSFTVRPDILAVLNKPEGNELVKLGIKLGVHARRIERLDVANCADHEAFLTVAAEIDTILRGIYGSDADWQEYRAKYEAVQE